MIYIASRVIFRAPVTWVTALHSKPIFSYDPCIGEAGGMKEAGVCKHEIIVSLPSSVVWTRIKISLLILTRHPQIPLGTQSLGQGLTELYFLKAAFTIFFFPYPQWIKLPHLMWNYCFSRNHHLENIFPPFGLFSIVNGVVIASCSGENNQTDNQSEILIKIDFVPLQWRKPALLFWPQKTPKSVLT